MRPGGTADALAVLNQAANKFIYSNALYHEEIFWQGAFTPSLISNQDRIELPAPRHITHSRNKGYKRAIT
jgi:hypothetical protein